MIYIRVGTDTERRQKADKLFSGTTRVLTGVEIESVKQYMSPDMFGNIETVRIEGWQGEKEREILYSYLKEMRDSKNIFLIDELSILPATLKKISAFAEKVFDCNVENEKVDPFVLASLIQKKDKKGAWIELQSIKNKIAAEELQGIMFWKMKTMRDKSGMFEMIRARHEAHEGGEGLYDALEKLILRM